MQMQLMAKNGHSEFFPTIFPKKTGINSEWPKIHNLNLFKPIWYKKTERNLEWPKLGIPNLFKSVMVCNGLKSNEICTFWGF